MRWDTVIRSGVPMQAFDAGRVGVHVGWWLLLNTNGPKKSHVNFGRFIGGWESLQVKFIRTPPIRSKQLVHYNCWEIGEKKEPYWFFGCGIFQHLLMWKTRERNNHRLARQVMIVEWPCPSWLRRVRSCLAIKCRGSNAPFSDWIQGKSKPRNCNFPT